MWRWAASCLMVVWLVGTGALADDRWPSTGGGGGSNIPQAIACSESSPDPNRCTSVTVVTDATSLETCMETAGDHVCYVNNKITVTDPAAAAAFLWDINAAAKIDIALVCGPDGQLVHNNTTVNAAKGIVTLALVAAAANEGTRITVAGCTIYEERNGVVGGGTGSVEGLVFKQTGDDTVRQRIVFRNNKVFVYSTGTSSIGMGLNPTHRADMLVDGNTVYGPIAIDLKGECAGCDEISHLVSNNKLYANRTVSSPRCAKVDDDQNTVWMNNTCTGGNISFDTSATSDGGDFILAGSENIFIDPVIDVVGFGGSGGVAFYYRNVTGRLTVYDNGGTGALNELVQFAVAGVIRLDLDVTFADCPRNNVTATAMGEFLDLRTLPVATRLDYIRLNISVPQGCAITLASISNGTPGVDGDVMELEIDQHNTVGILKVSNGDTASVNLFDGTATFLEFTLENDSRNATQVVCSSPGQSLIVDPDLPSATAFDTGNEAAAFCGQRCIDVQTVAGVDTTCAADLTGLGRHEVMMQ